MNWAHGFLWKLPVCRDFLQEVLVSEMILEVLASENCRALAAHKEIITKSTAAVRGRPASRYARALAVRNYIRRRQRDMGLMGLLTRADLPEGKKRECLACCEQAVRNVPGANGAPSALIASFRSLFWPSEASELANAAAGQPTAAARLG